MSSTIALNQSQDKDRNTDQKTYLEKKNMQRNDASNQAISKPELDVATARPAVSAAVEENVDGTFEERTDEQVQVILDHKRQCVTRGCRQSCPFCLAVNGNGGEEHTESGTVQASASPVYETISDEFTQIGATFVLGIPFVDGVHYKLGNPLGKGGNGIVYEVILLERGKEILGRQADNLAAKRANVGDQEKLVLKTLALANCPHSATHYFIVHKPLKIYWQNKETRQYESKDFEHLMFMKRAETSLLSYRNSLPGRVLAIKEASYYSRQLLESILFAHKLDPPIVHNDLKCSNVLLYHDGERYSAALTDYEYATTGDVPRCGGTPLFKAPKDAGPTNDIFSFGVMFLEMTICEDILTWPEFKAAVRELKKKNLALGLLIGACLQKESKMRPTAEYLLKRINEIGVDEKWWPGTSTPVPL